MEYFFVNFFEEKAYTEKKSQKKKLKNVPSRELNKKVIDND